MRRAGARDAAALAAALDEYFAAIEAEVGPQSGGEVAASLLRGSNRAWLAIAGRDVAGCVAMRRLSAHSCELKHLYVARRFRKRGIARRLVRTVQRHAQGAGFRRVYLNTLPSMTEAQSLYRREGYLVCRPYRDEPVCKIFLCKDLRINARRA